MDLEVYCDESRPDLFSSSSPSANYMVIGSIWIPRDLREEFKAGMHLLRQQHAIGGEAKWTKVSPSREAFYTAVINWFFAQREALRFRQSNK